MINTCDLCARGNPLTHWQHEHAYRDMTYLIPEPEGTFLSIGTAINRAYALAGADGYAVLDTLPRPERPVWANGGVQVHLDLAPAYSGTVPGCQGCAAGGPRHYPSLQCESGRRTHCSCDRCY